MNRAHLVQLIKAKRSYLCVGLDIDSQLMPQFAGKDIDAQWDYLKLTIDQTLPYAVAYKPNLAFYECQGTKGLALLERVCSYVKSTGSFLIADAKRGDIGNTAHKYAMAAFGELHADAVTVAPYMGKDSVSPFLTYPDKWAIVLGLTSNEGSSDFQQLPLSNQKPLYEAVLRTASTWSSVENLMFVIGATKAELFEEIRAIVPNHFLLVPGVGTQGGDLETLSAFGLIQDCGLLVNVGRAIMYPKATQWKELGEAIAFQAKTYQQSMEQLLKAHTRMLD